MSPPAFDRAVSNTRVGDAVSLGTFDADGKCSVGAVNAAGQCIGWLRDGDPLIGPLLGGARYLARVGKIVRDHYQDQVNGVVLEITFASGEPCAPSVSVETTVTIRIVADHAYEHAIANTKAGEELLLVRDDAAGGPRIAAVNQARQIVGWLPSTDPLVQQLRDCRRHSARFGQKTRSGYIYLAVTRDAGTLDIAGQ